MATCVGSINSFPLDLLQKFKESCLKFSVLQTPYLVLIDAKCQRLYLFHLEEGVSSYFVSTSRKGVGQVEGSGQTPLGLHRIIEKIGSDANTYAIFESRVNTGKICSPNDFSKDYIITRILRLSGLEDGFNKGKNRDQQVVDSYDRYIYIHGTNQVNDIGIAASIGCVRMKPDDMVDLFYKVPKNTLVYIFG